MRLIVVVIALAAAAASCKRPTPQPSGECVGPCPVSPTLSNVEPLCRAAGMHAHSMRCGGGTLLRLSTGFEVWQCHYGHRRTLIGVTRQGCIPDQDCTVGTLNVCDTTSMSEDHNLLCERARN